MDFHKENIQEIRKRLNQMAQMMRTLVGIQTHIVNIDQEWKVHDTKRITTRGICLEFPHFDGENIAGWIFKENQYFEYHQTPPPLRLLMASYHLDVKLLCGIRTK